MQLDCDKINQVLLNLTINAIQAMPDGGTLNVTSKWINVVPDEMEREQGSDGCLVISLQDTGGGILKDHLEKIFEPFYTTKEEGTGLGLAVVKKIIKAHKGSLQFDSVEGEYTRVLIDIPVDNGL